MNKWCLQIVYTKIKTYKSIWGESQGIKFVLEAEGGCGEREQLEVEEFNWKRLHRER